MNATILRAHFDGQEIILDEPAKLKPHTKLIITVLPESEHNDDKAQEERQAWWQLSMPGFEEAYGEVEAEYSLDELLSGVSKQNLHDEIE